MNYRINKNAERFAKEVSATPKLVYNISQVAFRLGDRYCIAAWTPGTTRPRYKYVASSQEMHDQHIAAILRAAEGFRQHDQAATAAAQTFRESLHVGDILDSTWGWEQSNIDFYQVISIRDSIVELRHLDQQTTETGFMCGVTIPIPSAFNCAARKYRISKDHVKISSCQRAYKWDGNPCRCSWYA